MPEEHKRTSRRRFIYGAGAAAAATGIAAHGVYRSTEGFQRADVFIGKANDYLALDAILLSGFAELGIRPDDIRGKTVLLKPNLVEPTSIAPHINTHPKFIQAVATALRSLGAREILVAEGPGHCRDTHLVLDESGFREALRDAKLEFIDLNVDDVDRIINPLGLTTLSELYLPRTLRRADLIVSLPKMKTHHWAGATLSMKNFFGVMPGICYGWPKNVLHREGIHESIADITATVRPHLAIVDGIVAMEGDGPIMGEAKLMGVVVMGRNLPAVDATCCRLMKLNPERIGYLQYASGRLGPIGERRIAQKGESIADLAQTFALLSHPELQALRG